MFKVSPFSSNTGAQPSTQLVICLVDDMLLQIRPSSSQATLPSNGLQWTCFCMSPQTL